MVKRTNDSDLISRGVDTLAVPFYQVWLELVGSKTLDVYQHRIFTSVSTIEELIEVAQKTIDGIFINNANIPQDTMLAL